MSQNSKTMKGCHTLIDLRFYRTAKSSLLKYISSSKGARNSQAHALLGEISLIQRDMAAAENHISKSLLIDRNNITALMGKAYIHLVNQNSEDALRTYFTILAIEPSNSLAKLNIEKIKKISKSGIKLVPRKYLIYSYVPSVLKPILLILFVFTIAFGSYLSINMLYPRIRIMFLDKEQRELREKLKDIYLFEGLEDGRIPESAQSPTYSPKEIADMFELAKDKMGVADVNSAMAIINKALHSDINDYLKEQFKRLSLFIIAPDYTLFRNNISYGTAISEPDIYIGGFVKWTVRVDSFKKSVDADGEEILLARVLVLSEDGKTTDGLAELECSIDTKLENNEKIEIYARIKNFDIVKKMTILNTIVIKHLPN